MNFQHHTGVFFGVFVQLFQICYRNNLLNYLHATHLGMRRMKAEARRYFWWSSLDKEIEKILFINVKVVQKILNNQLKLHYNNGQLLNNHGNVFILTSWENL
jgi:hypothetical protein